MKTKNNFTMWLFSKGLLKTLNWILVILAGIWIVGAFNQSYILTPKTGKKQAKTGKNQVKKAGKLREE